MEWVNKSDQALRMKETDLMRMDLANANIVDGVWGRMAAVL